MKIVYCTNIWNHYQGAFCREMAKLLEADFKLVLFTPLSELGMFAGGNDAIKQPWVKMPPNEYWIVHPPKTAAEVASGPWNVLMEEAEVAVVGYCPQVSLEALARRRRSGKVTFFIGERFFKKPIRFCDFFNPRVVRRWLFLRKLLDGKKTYYLEIGHWGHEDLRFLHVCRGRVFSWSYFPPVSEEFKPKDAHGKLRIGWCGRMIEWKHVEYIIKAMALVSPTCRAMCEVILVGEGVCKSGLIALAEELKLADVIRFETYKPVNETMNFMQGLDVYAFPSDRGEGWGVALMEAMDKGCVPIANADAGATLDLVDDGVNGFVFNDGNLRCIAEKIEWLVQHPEKRLEMSRAAWQTIQSWSPQRGAEKLINLIEYAESGETRKKLLPNYGLGSKRDC